MEKTNVNFILTQESEEYDAINDSYVVEDSQKIDPNIIRFCRDALQKFKCYVNIYDEVKIIFVKKIGNVLGRFRSGTALSAPIVILSAKELLSGAKEYKVPLSLVVETTIFHELGHAICEMDTDMEYDCLIISNEEEWVEDFAYNLYYNNEIPDDLQKLIASIIANQTGN
jgi:hypothetical protein